jgi:hypothetical protein
MFQWTTLVVMTHVDRTQNVKMLAILQAVHVSLAMMALHPLVHHVSHKLLSCLTQAQDQLRWVVKML